MALTTTISLEIITALTKALDLSVSPEARINLKKAIALATGTGANQADKVWHDQRTITASGTDSLDLAGGLTDALGDPLTFARIKALYVFAAAANTNNVNVTRPAANGVPLYLAAGDGEPVHPGGVLIKVWPGATAIPVTAGTGDLLDIVNSGAGTSVTYDIVIIGAGT